MKFEENLVHWKKFTTEVKNENELVYLETDLEKNYLETDLEKNYEVKRNLVRLEKLLVTPILIIFTFIIFTKFDIDNYR